MAKLYALLDTALLKSYKVSFERYFSFLGNLDDVAMVQYRNKHDSPEIQAEELETIRRYYQGKLLINDRIDLIALADGLHLGQEDLSRFGKNALEAADTVRKMIGGKIFGLSTHNLDEIQEANKMPLDYVGLGAYRQTGTKRDAKVHGESLLHLARRSVHPVALIGGVRLEESFDKTIAYKVVGSDLVKKIAPLQ